MTRSMPARDNKLLEDTKTVLLTLEERSRRKLSKVFGDIANRVGSSEIAIEEVGPVTGTSN